MTFHNFSLHSSLIEALESSGYSNPTDIQQKAIPIILEGKDIRASAQTGTGKTAAFLLPCLNLLHNTPRQKGPRLLVLAPTRELAMQVEKQAKKYSQFLPHIKSVCIVGGIPYANQTRKLSKPYDILIATPGRLMDFLERKKVRLDHLEMLVLDEADRMLDMGFVDDVRTIAAKTPSNRQTLLFSATFEKEIQHLSRELLTDPEDVFVHQRQKKHDHIAQKLYYVDNIHHKNQLLDHLLQNVPMQSAIIFTSTKKHAEILVDHLDNQGHKADVLHGDRNQRQRSRTLSKLQKGKTKVLVATDVASRGIDIPSITHVINFDLPRTSEDYVHRIGRTGRAGAKGTALSFAAPKDHFLIRKIEKFTGQKMDLEHIEGLKSKKSSFPPKSFNKGFSKTSFSTKHMFKGKNSHRKKQKKIAK